MRLDPNILFVLALAALMLVVVFLSAGLKNACHCISSSRIYVQFSSNRLDKTLVQ